MSLPDLAAVLWRQRELLERLTYKLECEQLLLAAGRTRWLAAATAEVEAQLDELGVVEVQRAAAADLVARELGLPPGSSLEDLAAAAQPPWTEMLLEHRQCLLTLTGDLSALAETNRHLMTAGIKAVESALANVGLGGGPRGADGYDAHGRTGGVGGTAQRSGGYPGGRSIIDRAL